jgi:hypothetical protein
MSPELIGQLTLQVLRLVNNIIESIPLEQRQEWHRDNKKFWDDVQELIKKLSSGEFKLPDLKLPEFKFPASPLTPTRPGGTS